MTTYDQPYINPRPHDPGPGLSPWLIRIPVLFITGGVILLTILLALVAAFRINYEDRITPGVVALGVELGGLTREEAIPLLESQFTYDETAVFTINYAGQSRQLTAGELGVTFNAAATVDQALAISHDESPASDLLDQARVWFNGQAITPVIEYDQSVTIEQLNAIAAATIRPAQDATLRLDGTTIISTPAQTGRAVDLTPALIQIEDYIRTLALAGEVTLTVQETYPNVWNIDDALNRANAALSSPLELTATDATGQQLGPWTVSTEQIAALLDIELVDGRYEVGIDMSAFAAHLQTLAPGLIQAPRDGRFHFDEASGQLNVIRPAINGRELNIPETLRLLEQAVFRYDNRRVPMAFDYTLPRFHDGITAAELGITQLVAESTTYYTGSSDNRRHNISHGASIFDGLIIAPGEEFSFNTILGDISLEAGFREGKVIVGGRTVDGVGGGICQVSTTAFRAAFSGGFPIIERNTHAYRVGYYELNGPPGLDAAIWSPERDFRFQNDTNYHLLIETSVYPANNTLQFRFYSTNPGRLVEIEEPVIRNIEPAEPTRFEANDELQPGQTLQVDYAAEGADVNVRRIIRDLNGNIIDETNIFTHYLPWGAIYQVHPTDSRLR